MQITKVKFEDVKHLICVRGTHIEIYEAVKNLKKGDAIKVILDNPKSVLTSLLNGHYLKRKIKRDFVCSRLKDKKGWIVRK